MLTFFTQTRAPSRLVWSPQASLLLPQIFHPDLFTAVLPHLHILCFFNQCRSPVLPMCHSISSASTSRSICIGTPSSSFNSSPSSWCGADFLFAPTQWGHHFLYGICVLIWLSHSTLVGDTTFFCPLIVLPSVSSSCSSSFFFYIFNKPKLKICCFYYLKMNAFYTY